MIIMSTPLSMSVLQTVNLIIVLLNMMVFNFNSFTFMFVFMLYSGYLGGSIYLNTFFIITQKRLKKLDKPEYYDAMQPVAFED